MVTRLTERISSILAVLSAIAIAIMAVGTCANVITRALLDKPLPGVIEISSLLVVAAVFAALAEAERAEVHVRMRLVTDRLHSRIANSVRTIAMIATITITGLMVYATALRAHLSFATGETQVSALRWPIWPTRAMIAIGLSLLFVILILKAVTLLRAALTDAILIDAD